MLRRTSSARVRKHAVGGFMLKHNTLGKTPLMVSPLGLGTVKFGRNTGVKYPGVFELPSDDRVAELLSCARELGINLIDTAPAYGTSEERLGVLLPRVAPRENWVICTKSGEEFEQGASRFDFTPDAITRSAERSAIRLRTDSIDILLLHSDGECERRLDSLGVAQVMSGLKHRGLVRAWGVSVKTEAGARWTIDHADVLMVEYGVTHAGTRALIDLAHTRGVGVLVKKALASGHAADPGAALRFALEPAGVSSVIVGTLSPDHLRANARGSLPTRS